MQSFPIHTFTQQELPTPMSAPLWLLDPKPKEIHIQGSAEALELLHRLPERGLAVVGTRGPQHRSKLETRKRILELSGSDLIIISGMARGIDSVAHQAAMDAGLPTIAVLGCGLDQTYPPENVTLRRDILESGGLIVSEFPMKTQAEGNHFLLRNRIIAGWSQATWVVEASLRSGALNTARWARDSGRVCYATPSFPGDPRMAGNQILMERDQARPFWGIHELGEVWIEFAARPTGSKGKKLRSAPREADPDAWILSEQVSHQTPQFGGASIQELFDWSLAHDWTPQRFYFALKKALETRLLLDENGLLLKNLP